MFSRNNIDSNHSKVFKNLSEKKEKNKYKLEKGPKMTAFQPVSRKNLSNDYFMFKINFEFV